MTTSYIDDSLLTGIADAIRAKNGESAHYTPAEMATAIAAISGGGGGASLDPIVKAMLGISMTSSEKIDITANDIAAFIGEGVTNAYLTNYGLAYAAYLDEVTLPSNLKGIQQYAFYKSSLRKVSMPSFTLSGNFVIGSYTFNQCTQLEEIDFSNIPGNFQNASNMCESCSALQVAKIKFDPSINSGGAQSMFQYCTSLTDVYIYGKCNSFAKWMFRGCTALTGVHIEDKSLIAVVGSGAFQNCSSLTRLDFGVDQNGNNGLSIIQSYAFSGCSSLATLVIDRNTPPTIQNVNAFDNTPIASGTGYVYVPDAKVDTYKATGNWVNFANQIKGISQLPS